MGTGVTKIARQFTETALDLCGKLRIVLQYRMFAFSIGSEYNTTRRHQYPVFRIIAPTIMVHVNRQDGEILPAKTGNALPISIHDMLSTPQGKVELPAGFDYLIGAFKGGG